MVAQLHLFYLVMGESIEIVPTIWALFIILASRWYSGSVYQKKADIGGNS